MDVREKLVELIFDSLLRHIDKSCKLAENIADDLISSGVTVKENMEISDELFKQLKNAPITICKEEPSIETVQEWISVEDRLQEPFVSVLVHMPGEEPLPTVHEGFISNDGIWQSTMFRREPGEVTHWQPMPQPPKGE